MNNRCLILGKTSLCNSSLAQSIRLNRKLSRKFHMVSGGARVMKLRISRDIGNIPKYLKSEVSHGDRLQGGNRISSSHHPTIFGLFFHTSTTLSVWSLRYVQISNPSHLFIIYINSTEPWSNSVCFFTLLAFALCVFYSRNNPEIFLIWEYFTVWIWIKASQSLRWLRLVCEGLLQLIKQIKYDARDSKSPNLISLMYVQPQNRLCYYNNTTIIVIYRDGAFFISSPKFTQKKGEKIIDDK